MAARLIAGLIVAAGVLLLAVVGLRGDSRPDTELASSSAGSSDEEAPIATNETPVLDGAPENLGPRKDLVNLDGWLNTEITNLDELDGKVVLVEMWTFGCSNCKARIPHNQDLYATLSREEFEIVGVHAPEFSFEAEIPNIEAAVLDLGVTWPVAIDTNKESFRAWQDGGRRFWPRTYVVDQNGDVRFDHIGEGKYDELEQTVNWLLENPPA
jgi:thiol-disulfide isomerase/thioredoxin